MPAIAPTTTPSPNVFKRIWRAIDDYTSPRESTGGDLEENDYIQSLLHAGGAGYSFMGFQGVGIASACAVASTFVARRTDSRAAALATGALVGGVTAAAASALAGPISPALIAGGVLLGGLQALRGDKLSRVRDASGGATMLTGLFLPGTSKIAGAVAAGVAGSQDKPVARALVGAATGVAIGAALGALGLAPGGVVLTAALSGLGGAVGPFFGPRFSQFFRNLGNDCGKGVKILAEKVGLDPSKANPKTMDMVGALPAQIAKEAVRGFINSDFDVKGIVASGLSEAVEQIHLIWAQKAPQETPKD